MMKSPLVAVVGCVLCGAAMRAQAPGTLSGVVKEDSTGRPVTGAVVAVEALKRQATTDAEGRFRLTDVASGVRMVTVRRLGYLPAGMMVQFLPNEVVEKALLLSPSPTELDTMKVVDKGKRLAVGRDAFEDRRKRGFGRFLDSTDLRKLPFDKVSDLLSSEKGVTVVKPPMCSNYNNMPEMKGNVHRFNCNNSASGTVRVAMSRSLCAMKIRLNGQSLNYGGEIDARDDVFDARRNWNTVFDITSLDLGSMEKIEIYHREDEVPLELKGTDTECGLIMLWSRQ